jgi:phosphatidylserine/phosphatidylglycerophosphate/cardiolipin synthase-like enzyme
VLYALAERIAPHQETMLEIYRTRGTHQKILVQDTVLAVNTSFNWLSYRGQQDADYRTETGAVFRDPLAVAALREEAEETLRGAERVRLR